MRIDRNGVWHHEGRPIARTALVKLFAGVLRKEADGGYWLVTPAERGRIEVEDVPFLVVGIEVEGEGRGRSIRVRSNLDEWATIGADHPLRVRRPRGPASGDGPIPYVEIRPGLEGRVARSVYYDLAALGEEHLDNDTVRFGVWSDGLFFALDPPSSDRSSS